jgi:hypothetical protein
VSSEFDSIVGRTVVGVDVGCPDDEWAPRDRVVFRLDDGSWLRVAGHSYEECDLSAELLSPADQAREAEERRVEAERRERLEVEREARLAARTPEEVERDERRARIWDEAFRGAYSDLARDLNRQVWPSSK